MTRNDIRIVHALPGRVRFRIAAFKADSGQGSAIETRLKAIRGIQTVETAPLTGSILVQFDPQTLTISEFLDTLSEVLSDFFPELSKINLAEFLLPSERTELSLAEKLADLLSGSSGRLAGILNPKDIRLWLIVAFLVFGLPRLRKK